MKWRISEAKQSETFFIKSFHIHMLPMFEQINLFYCILRHFCAGLAQADSGTINVLGENLEIGNTVMTASHMMGYCHRSETLIDDLTVHEHLILYTEVKY